MASTTQPALSGRVRTAAGSAWITSTGLLLALVFLLVATLVRLNPPSAVPANAPATVFSSARAMAHLREIAQRPHPTGSAENVRVREYLVAQLAALGLQPEVQRATSVAHAEMITTAAVVHNIIARIDGTASIGAILLVAHYDSVPTSPGASDDGSGVVAILEAVRALLAGPRLQNDVIVLFTDGEELGLLGARAFAADHPWMGDVALVLNLEARGASGPVVLFETSDANAGLIGEYSEAAPHPVTSSLLPSLYRMLPNDTDLTVFLRQDVPGLNFAYADDWTRYHTGRDSLADIDERSVQHHGMNLLALVQQFGNHDLRETGEADAIFFSVLSQWIIHYPQSWAMPVAVLATLSFLGLLLFGRARRRLTFAGVALGGVATVACAAVLGGLAYLGVQALNVLEANELSVFMGGTYNVHWYELGFLLLFLGVGGWLTTAVARRVQPLNLSTGALLVWLILAVACAILLPGASYLFAWPALAGLVALAVRLAIPHEALTRLSVLLPASVGIGVATPALYLVLVMAGINGVVLLAVMIALFLGVVLPQFTQEDKPHAWTWQMAAVPMGTGVALLLAVALATNYDSAHPRQNMLFYSLNADTREAAWVTLGQIEEPWAESFTGSNPTHEHLSEHMPLLSFIDLKAAHGNAPALALPPPTVTVLADTLRGNTRTVKLHVASQRGSGEIALLIAAPKGVLSTSVYGNMITYDRSQTEVMLNGVALRREGFDLTLTLHANDPLTVRVADVTPALPDLPSIQATRPNNVTGVAGGFTPDSSTVVHRTMVIPAP